MDQTLESLTLRFCEAVAVFAKTVGLCGLVEGRVFARLVLSEHPLTQDELMELVGASRGNISQAIRNLMEVGFVRKAAPRGSRRVCYETHADLWRITVGAVLLRMRRQIDLVTTEFSGLRSEAAALKQGGSSAVTRHDAARLLRHIERFERFTRTAATLTQGIQRLVDRESHRAGS